MDKVPERSKEMTKVIHKLKLRHGWSTKLCDATLFADICTSFLWRDVTCPRCLKLKRKQAK